MFEFRSAHFTILTWRNLPGSATSLCFFLPNVLLFMLFFCQQGGHFFNYRALLVFAVWKLMYSKPFGDKRFLKSAIINSVIHLTRSSLLDGEKITKNTKSSMINVIILHPMFQICKENHSFNIQVFFYSYQVCKLHDEAKVLSKNFYSTNFFSQFSVKWKCV